MIYLINQPTPDKKMTNDEVSPTKIPWRGIGKFSKWALIAFILFEISQIVIGTYIGLKIALGAYGITF